MWLWMGIKAKLLYSGHQSSLHVHQCLTPDSYQAQLDTTRKHSVAQWRFTPVSDPGRYLHLDPVRHRYEEGT